MGGERWTEVERTVGPGSIGRRRSTCDIETMLARQEEVDAEVGGSLQRLLAPPTGRAVSCRSRSERVAGVAHPRERPAVVHGGGVTRAEAVAHSAVDAGTVATIARCGWKTSTRSTSSGG